MTKTTSSSLHRWRAKFRHHGVDYSVGSYATELEKNAAVAAGKQLFERLDKEAAGAAIPPTVKPKPKPKRISTPTAAKPPRPLYSRKSMLEQLVQDIETGRFDTMLEAVLKAALARHDMLGKLPTQWETVAYDNKAKKPLAVASTREW